MSLTWDDTPVATPPALALQPTLPDVASYAYAPAVGLLAREFGSTEVTT